MKLPLLRSSFDTDESYDLLGNLIETVNFLFGELYRPDELPSVALQSYYVDFYLAQANNGGLSQFVYNSRWNEQIVGRVRSGLQAMGATQHAALFAELERAVEARRDHLEEFLESGYFGDEPTGARDALNELNDRFFELEESEDLAAKNAAWVRRSDQVEVLDENKYRAALERLAALVPDKAARREEAERFAVENEPEEEKIIRRLCASIGAELVSINALSPGQYEGQPILEWHMTTSEGHHFAVFLPEEARLLSGYGADAQIVAVEKLDAPTSD